MGLRFVLGRARAGKTRHCAKQIVDLARAEPLGPPIYYVVPKQATFAAQRRLAMGSGLDGFCRVRVVSFERLADDVIAECGGDAIPAVTPRGRRMIIAHLLRQHSGRLRVYQRSAGRIGLADELDATFAEMESHGHDAYTLAELIQRLAADDPTPPPATQRLIDKLHDVQLLYAAYQDFLTKDRVDPHRRLRQVLEIVKDCESIRGAHVFVDGHLDFSHVECRLVATLARYAKSVSVTMLMEPTSRIVENPLAGPADDSLFHRTERAYARLRRALQADSIEPDPPLRLAPPPTGTFALNGLEAGLFDPRAAPRPADDGSVTSAELPDRRGEVAYAATVIRRWMREDGLRPRQIAVLCRGQSPWHDLIEAEFAEHGIPFFTDRRRTASHHALLQIVPAMLAAFTEGYPHESMMTLAKSGLCGIGRGAADELENYVLRHSILGEGWASAEPWTFSRPDRADEENGDAPPPPPAQADFADALRRKLVDPLARLDEALHAKRPLTVREMTAAVYETIVAYAADKALVEQIEAAEQAGNLELAAEHEQVWSELSDLLDELVDVLGDQALSAADFVETLTGALAEFDLAIAPPTVDQVIVGDVERTRFEHFDAVVLMGWNEGEFPHLSAEPTVLGDGERRRLSEGLGNREFSLDGDTRRQLLDESLLAYLAVTRARKRLCVTRHLADDDGRAVNPSMFWRELRRLAPAAFPPDRDDETAAPAPPPIAATPRKLAARLAAWARGGPEAVTRDPGATALYQAVAAGLPPQDPTRAAVARAWAALSYMNEARLAPRTIAGLFTGTLDASVSQIEAFAECPYKHFLRSVLRLKPRPEPELTALDMGSLLHSVLERLVGAQVKKKLRWNPKHRPSRAEIRTAVQAAGEALRGEVMLTSARNQYVLATVERAVDDVLAWQHEIGACGDLQPAGVEVTFGDLGDLSGPAGADGKPVCLDPLVLKTPGGRTVRLRGKVDRVDVPPKAAAETPCAVFDYKAKCRQLSLPEVYHGLALQLLTYLLVLQANGAKLAGRPLAPFAAFYVQLLRGIESLKTPDEEQSVVQLRGVFDKTHVGHLRSAGADPDAGQFFVDGLNQNGSFNKNRTGDSTSSEEFAALLAFVRDKVAEIADRIVCGDVRIRPYRLGDKTPCSSCDYASVCRFDSAVDRYCHLDSVARKDVLDFVVSKGAAGR